MSIRFAIPPAALARIHLDAHSRLVRWSLPHGAALRTVGLVTVLAWSCLCFAISGQAGPYTFRLVTNPVVLTTGQADLLFTVTDAAGHKLDGLTIRALVKMPGMDMGEREQIAHPTGEPGVYTAPASLAMDGTYLASVAISGAEGQAQTTVNLSTGEDTSGEGRSSPVPLIAGVVALSAGLIIWQRRRAGLPIGMSRATIGSVLLLVVVLFAAIWVVQHWRRPGAMTPIDAQAMAMETPPPPGAIPVRLAVVRIKPFTPTIRYPGQTAAYTEQAVTPRVTGTILSMPVYLGDRVRKGQLLAQLDTSQLDPEVAARSAEVAQAGQSVAEASASVDQALRQVDQSKSDVITAKSAQDEASTMVQAAKEVADGAHATVKADEDSLEATNEEVKSAEADLQYARAQYKRDQMLVQAGVIPAQQMDRSKADADKAAAAAREASDKVSESEASILSAQAALRQADVEVTAAQRRADQSISEVASKQAVLATMEAGVKVAGSRVGEQEDSVRAAAAALQSADVQRGFAELRAEVDGAVVERDMAPGQVVTAGQVVLKVDRFSPLRLQANVAQEDLAKLHLGDQVNATIDGHEVKALLTAIQPGVTVDARTGVVEALIPNTDGRFKPGEFLSMEIGVAEAAPVAVIPVSAVVWPTASWPKPTVWVAANQVAKRVEVALGDQNGDEIAVMHGLNDGDQVILTPPVDMLDGTAVVDEASEGATELTGVQASRPPISPTAPVHVVDVRFTSNGFEPKQVLVASGVPAHLRFSRLPTATCATTVLFPSLGRTIDVQLNQSPEIVLPALARGQSLDFECGMHMFKGQVVAQ